MLIRKIWYVDHTPKGTPSPPSDTPQHGHRSPPFPYTSKFADICSLFWFARSHFSIFDQAVKSHGPNDSWGNCHSFWANLQCNSCNRIINNLNYYTLVHHISKTDISNMSNLPYHSLHPSAQHHSKIPGPTYRSYYQNTSKQHFQNDFIALTNS